ncbi:hypothetical protein FKM82_027035 [Ascaphus truei]
MKTTKLFLVSGSLCGPQRCEVNLEMACSPLFGKRLLGERNGSGVTRLLSPSLESSLTVNLGNPLSSLEGVCLSSFLVVWNAVHRSSSVHFSCTRTSPRSLVKRFCVSLLTAIGRLFSPWT